LTINITAVGGSGTHTLQKVNVNLDEDYIYFPGRDINNTKATNLVNDSAWVVRETTATIDGLDSGEVYFLNTTDNFSVGFTTTAESNTNINLTEYSTGNITFNFPSVYDNSINITSVKYDDVQAVKYLTDSTPITGLTSGDTYYVKNLLTGLGGSALYLFDNHTFTTVQKIAHSKVLL
jgi:hypothetical protein